MRHFIDLLNENNTKNIIADMLVKKGEDMTTAIAVAHAVVKLSPEDRDKELTRRGFSPEEIEMVNQDSSKYDTPIRPTNAQPPTSDYQKTWSDDELDALFKDSKDNTTMKKELNEQRLDENPLILALMGALVGMGLEKEKAKKAAAQAVADAEANGGQAGAAPAAPPQGDDYNQTMRRGSRGEGVKQLQQKLGMRQVDGIFGPATERAVRTFQQSQGIKVDGIVGPETRARIMRLRSDDGTTARRNNAAPLDGGIAPGTTTGGPSQLQQRMTANSSKENTGNPINEAVSFEVEDLIRLMQLAGADGAKAVDTDDINPGPKPCPICGKMHGPSQPLGGCGAKSDEPEMGDMIRMISAEEEELDGDFQDASTEPDEEYANDVSASIPAGNDLHKKKKAYPAVDGGDNPMTAENLEAKIREHLKK